jgi:hypothetical protein
MRVESAATSLSWIPSEAVTGPPRTAFTVGFAHYDPPPPGTLSDLDGLWRADRFRFANRMRVWAEFTGDRVTGYGQDGGGIMGSTTVRIAALSATFAAVGMPDLRPEPKIGDGWIRFTQTCGGRTALAAPRSVHRPPYLRITAPLVWMTLAITLHADGRSEVGLAGASPFPRHWIYGPDGTLALKAGVADFSSWMDQPSWRHTPWGDEDSPAVVTAAETALERELSTRLMRHGRKPTIRRIGAGATLAEQGTPGDSLFLVLDGVLRVAVGGESLGELGPGAVVGERAVLEGGARTATLTALTPVRVAEAGADAIDPAALAVLAEGHRREETRAGAAGI